MMTWFYIASLYDGAVGNEGYLKNAIPLTLLGTSADQIKVYNNNHFPNELLEIAFKMIKIKILQMFKLLQFKLLDVHLKTSVTF